MQVALRNVFLPTLPTEAAPHRGVFWSETCLNQQSPRPFARNGMTLTLLGQPQQSQDSFIATNKCAAQFPLWMGAAHEFEFPLIEYQKWIHGLNQSDESTNYWPVDVLMLARPS
jgi:hypothetical protein